MDNGPPVTHNTTHTKHTVADPWGDGTKGKVWIFWEKDKEGMMGIRQFILEKSKKALFLMAKKILDINLSKKEYSEKSLDDKIIHDYVGGKGLATKLLCDYLDPKTDPLSEENIFIAMSGSLAPYVPKFVVVSKSPLTNTICTSNCGGDFGSMLKKSGYEGIIIRGKDTLDGSTSNKSYLAYNKIRRPNSKKKIKEIHLSVL